MLNAINEAVQAIRAELGSLSAGNSEKAEVDADLIQLAAETERPAPRRTFLKLFVESARDNLAKAGGASVAGAALLVVARLLHLIW